MHYLDGRNVFYGYGAPPLLGGGNQKNVQLNPKQPMTAARCVTLCAQHNLIYKGVNLQGQCTCGNPLPNQLTPTPAPQQLSPTPRAAPPVLRKVDCVGLPIVPSPHGSLPTNLMRRIQASLNYANPPLNIAPDTGQFDFLTQLAWAAFVKRYGTWDSGMQKYIGSDPGSITCDGLMLLKATNDQIYASQQAFIGPLDDGTPGRVAADPSSSITFEERDMLWVVSPDARPDFRQALQNLTHTVTKTGLGGTIYARCQPSSGPIALGKDALTAIRTKIAAGYAAMIATKSDFSSVWVAYTKDPHVIAVSCSTKGSLRQAQSGGTSGFGGMGFGVVLSASQGSPGGVVSLLGGGLQDDPSNTPPQAPDPTTGLPSWALYEGEPPTLIDAARALFTVTGAAPSPAPPPAGDTTAPPPSYTPPPYPSAAPPAAAPAASVSPSWVKPLAILGGLGIVAYFAFGE